MEGSLYWVTCAPLEGPSGDNWWFLRFASTDTQSFRLAVATVKRLPLLVREYDPQSRGWWVENGALHLLAKQGWPSLAEQLRLAEGGPRQREHTGGDGGAGSYKNKKPQQKQRVGSVTVEAPGMPQQVLEAFAALYVIPGAPPQVIRAARGTLMRTIHPDVAGYAKTEDAKRLNLAADLALEWTAQQEAAAETTAQSA
jgi:hypothetical protein